MKKQSSDCYIAATHFSIAGMAVPFLVRVLGSFLPSILISITPSLTAKIIIIILFGFIFLVLGIWLGSIYSARLLKKTYVITFESKQRIVRLATIYFVVWQLLSSFFFLGIIGITGGKFDSAVIVSFLSDFLLYVIIGGPLFYYFSQRYITEDSTITNQK